MKTRSILCGIFWYLRKIPIIEKLNHLRINVFGYEDNELCPLYIFEKRNPDVMNLLLVVDGEKNALLSLRYLNTFNGIN